MQLDFAKGGRPRMLAYIVLILMSIFIVRLFYLQIVRHDHYVGLASAEQLKQRILPAQRGEIYAMNGTGTVKLVMNETVYTVFADPKIIDSETESKVISAIKDIAGGNARSNLKELLGKKESRYQIIATKISTTQAALLKERKLVGIGFQKESQRVYPEGQLAAQSLGFVDNAGLGQYGIEGMLNSRLTGKDGLLQSVTDIRDVPLTIGNKNINTPAVNGDNIVMTIDRNVQSYTEKALADGLKRSGATHGSVMVMDPQTGKVLAMANLPTFDPSNYGQVEDIANFNNDTISAPYEPGSVIKTLTMATGIDKGVVEPESTYNNTDSIRVEDVTIGNAAKGHTGMITLQTALDYSLNTGFVTVAQRLGDGNYITRQARDTIYEYFHDKFGLGTRTGIELQNEAAGIVIAPTEADGGAVRYSNMAFGQGLDVTMVQVCAAFSTIVNGGTYRTPTVVAGTMDDEGRSFTKAPLLPTRTAVISQDASNKMRMMTHDARTGFYKDIDTAGYFVGGKTGTSETLKGNGYTDTQTVGTYLGFGGDSNSDTGPKYVIMVQVSGKNMNLGGGDDAMPIFTDISNWMLDYMKLQPKG